MGMAHRGRLNVLANIVGKSYDADLPRVRGRARPERAAGLGRREVPRRRDRQVHRRRRARRSRITLAANPSHLEAVDPVVEGMARAKQDRLRRRRRTTRCCRCSSTATPRSRARAWSPRRSTSRSCPGYDVGGTVHIVVNNQVGFTTTPGFARSTVYATDIAKAVQAPIFHVNGDDPEACVRVIRLAFEFRQAFKKDVVVDMVCYRRYGHNEGDEPAFTQPRMYEVIGQRRSVRKLYTELLVNRGDLTLEDAEQALEDFRARLDAAFEETQRARARSRGRRTARVGAGDRAPSPRRDRRAARDRLDADRRRARRPCPDGFDAAPEARSASSRNRRTEFDDDQRRLGARRGARVRLAAARRHAGAARRPGHAARHVQPAPRGARRPPTPRQEYTPLAHLGADAGAVHDLRLGALGVRRARLRVRLLGRRPRRARVLGSAVRRLRQRRADRSSTSSSSRPRTSGASAAASCCCSPTASRARARSTPSARLERFLVLCAEDNMRVVYPTTAGAVLPRAAPPGARRRRASR